MNYLKIEGDIDLVFGVGKSIPWDAYGMDLGVIREAIKTKHQISLNDKMISLFPITSETLFYSNLWPNISMMSNVVILDEESAEKLHASLLLNSAEKEYEESLIPTEEEIYQSQMLLASVMLQEYLANKENL